MYLPEFYQQRLMAVTPKKGRIERKTDKIQLFTLKLQPHARSLGANRQRGSWTMLGWHS